MIKARFPTVRTLRLSGSGLLVTYGELNTLADYLADPAALDSLPKNIIEPILQSVRQESHYWSASCWVPRRRPGRGRSRAP